MKKEDPFLIVDDSTAARKLVQKLCETLGYGNFVHANNGKNAFETIESMDSVPGIILCDYNMPEATGVEFIKKVKEQEKYKDVPVLFISSEGEKNAIIEALSVGANNYLVKPFEKEEFEEKFNALAGEK